MVHRTWPQFREKYLDPLKGEEVTRDFEAMRRDIDLENSPAAITRLYRAMQVAIFELNCRQGWQSPPSIPSDSPLREQI